MKSLPLAVLSAAFAFGLLSVLPAAASPPPKSAHYIEGILCAYSPHRSVKISPPTSDCNHQTYSLKVTKHSRLQDRTQPHSKIASGDSVAAFVTWKAGHAVAHVLEYGRSGFIFRHQKLSGRFLRVFGNCPLLNLTMHIPHQKAALSLSTYAFTTFAKGKRTNSCRTFVSRLKKGMSITVRAAEGTDGTWSADRITIPAK